VDHSHITDDAVTELKVGDRVQLDSQSRDDDYGVVVEPPSLMYPNDPGPRVRVEMPLVGIRTITPLVSEVRRVPPGEEQEIWLRPWIVTGESICDDPDEYNHPHMLFVHEGSLPEIIRTYLAANGLTPPGTAAALPVLDTTQADECVRDLLQAVYPGDPMPDRPLDTIWNHLLEQVRRYVNELDEMRRRDAEYTASLRGEQG
jgi:hypothetical protein